VAEVAPLLGLAPNAVAALAYRAREGLRQAYLQAHLREQHVAECRECAENLGAYVRDGLSARDRRRIDAHLDGCDSCKALVAELADTNNTLRAALIPALIGVSSAAYLAGLGGKGLLGTITRMPKRQQLATASGAVAAVAVVAALVAGAFGRADGPSAVPAPASGSVSTIVAPDGTERDRDRDDPTTATSPTTPRETTPSRTTVPSDTTTTSSTTIAQFVPAPPVTVRATGNTTRPVVTFMAPPPVTTRPTVPGGTTPATTTPTTTPTTTTPAGVPTTVPSTVPATPPPTAPPGPSLLSVSAVQRSAALRNGQVRIDVTVANTGPAAAAGVQLDLPATAGSSFIGVQGLDTAAVTFVRAFASGWSCAGNVSCTLPSLPPGQSSVLSLTFAIGASAPASITFTPAISQPAGAVVASTPITISVATVPGLLAAETERGAIVAIGNSVTTCTDADGACAGARAGVGPTLNHNSFAMQYVNTAGGSFDSSSAALALTGTVSKAVLVWAGDVDQAGAAPNPSAANTVSFSTPAGTTTVTADVLQSFDALVPGNTGMYAAYADVTALVTGSGTYSVADIQTALGTASFGGWSLVIIEHDPSLPERFMVLTAPLAPINGAPDPAFSIGLWQPMSNASATLTAVGFEGERTLTGDSVTVSGCTIANAFRGAVPGSRNPADDNTLGTDVLVAPCSGLNGPLLSFGSGTSDDRVMLALVAIALDV
jgi:hypothetical protein